MTPNPPKDQLGESRMVVSGGAVSPENRSNDGVALWSCPECAFTFDAAHTDTDGGGYSCPLCAEIDLESRLDAALARIAAVEALHFARGRNILGKPACAECSPLQPMPCPTLRALAASPTTSDDLTLRDPTGGASIVPVLIESVQWAVRQIDEALTDSRTSEAAAAWLRTIREGLTNSSGVVPQGPAADSRTAEVAALRDEIDRRNACAQCRHRASLHGRGYSGCQACGCARFVAPDPAVEVPACTVCGEADHSVSWKHCEAATIGASNGPVEVPAPTPTGPEPKWIGQGYDALDVAPPTGNHAPFERASTLQPMSEPTGRPTPEPVTDPVAWLPEHLRYISRTVTASYPKGMDAELVMRRRVGKIFVEAGELGDAIEGYTAENPRKGLYATADDVIKELIDCASASLCAIEYMTGDKGKAVGLLAAQVAGNAQRLSESIPDTCVDRTLDEVMREREDRLFAAMTADEYASLPVPATPEPTEETP